MAGDENRGATNEDLFTATSRLSKAVTSTATALMTNNSDHTSLLLKSTHYQKAIYDTLIGPHKKSSKNLNYNNKSYDLVNFRNKKKAPSEFLRLNFSKDEISYRAITHIPDDLLNEIPENDPNENDEQYSLFQGFNASIPQVDEELYLFKEMNMDNLKLSTNNNQKLIALDSTDEKSKIIIEKKLNNPLPIDISSKKIRQTKSTKSLSIYKQKILKKMHYLEIKKDISSNEVLELDEKIQKLTAKRDALFQKIAKIEKDEIYLEGFIQEINEKVENLNEGKEADDEDLSETEDLEVKNHKNDNSNPINDENSEPKKVKKNTTFKDEPEIYSETDNETLEEYTVINNDEESDDMLLSKSIYNSLQKKPPNFHKISSKNRKIRPTLQNYYSSGTEISSFQAHEDKITCFDFDYPFGTMVSSSVDGTLRVWDLSNQKCLTLLEGHDSHVNCMQMSDNLLVTGSDDTNLKMWDLSKVENQEYDEDEDEYDKIVMNNIEIKEDDNKDPCVYTFESHVDEITALHFDENNLISGSSDKTIRQWDLQTGHCLQTLDVLWVLNNSSPMDSSISQLPISHNSTFPFISALQCYSAALASGTADGMVRLWDLRSGEVVRTLTGHTGPVTCLQFDEKSIITGSEDCSIKIWDLRMGKIQKNLHFNDNKTIESLQFDDEKIVFTNNNPVINVFDRNDESINSLTKKEFNSNAKFARFKEGYLIGGYSNGIVKTWAV